MRKNRVRCLKKESYNPFKRDSFYEEKTYKIRN